MSALATAPTVSVPIHSAPAHEREAHADATRLPVFDDDADRLASEQRGNHLEPAEGAKHRALRFLTAGSVDDGKSTLIGRLLYDSRAVLADQVETLEKRASAAPQADGGPGFDLSLLTDGLEAEREQGITIDVAYRYFATPRRKFIIADAPGHEQYTRNMVTAAAGSDAAVVLVDITKIDTRPVRGANGVAPVRAVELLAQTRRHALLAQLLRVPNIVFAINKLDAVADPAQAYAAVRDALLAFAHEAGISVAGVIPVSALRGDNVTLPPRSAPGPLRGWAAWYHGPSLLELLERLPAVQEQADAALLIPVQYVARESARRDGSGIHLVHAAPDNYAGPIAPPGEQPRTLWGRIAQGRVQRGDAVQLFPSGEQAKVTEVRVAGRVVDTAQAGQSAGLVLDRHLDVSRGDWIAGPRALRETRRFHATLAWLDTESAVVGRKYWVRHGSRWVQARIAAIESRLDIHTLAASAAQELAVNDIGHVIVETQQALPLEAFEASRVGGALIVVDPTSNRTSGALLVKEPA